MDFRGLCLTWSASCSEYSCNSLLSCKPRNPEPQKPQQRLTLDSVPQGPRRKWALRGPTQVRREAVTMCVKRLIHSFEYFHKNMCTASLTPASSMVALVLWVPKSWVRCWDPRMGYAIEETSDISSTSVIYLSWNVRNRVQDALSPCTCVPSNPLPLPHLWGISADREAEDRKKAGGVLGKRGEWHIFVLGNWSNVPLGFHWIQWSLLHH